MNEIIQLIKYLYMFYSIIGVAAVCLTLWFITSTALKARKNGDYTKLIHNIISLFCIIAASAAWLLNYGWLKKVLTAMSLPLFHSIVFHYIGNYTAGYLKESRVLKLYSVLSYATYLLFYIMLPDGINTSSMQSLFGLIGYSSADTCFYIAMTAFMANIVILILQLIQTVITKNKGKRTPASYPGQS